MSRVIRGDGYSLYGGAGANGERHYEVRDDAGDLIGFVGTYMATMERRSPGKRYANARWDSRRWWAHPRKGRVYFGRFVSAAEAVRWIESMEGV